MNQFDVSLVQYTISQFCVVIISQYSFVHFKTILLPFYIHCLHNETSITVSWQKNLQADSSDLGFEPS